MLHTFSSDTFLVWLGEEAYQTSAGEGVFCELRLYGVPGSTHPAIFLAHRSNTGGVPSPVDWGVYHVRRARPDDFIRLAQTAPSEGGR